LIGYANGLITEIQSRGSAVVVLNINMPMKR
jgi:hypothetical protein